jgi:hypothetical protein
MIRQGRHASPRWIHRVRSEPRLVGYAFTPQIQSPEHGQDLGTAITVLSGPKQTSCVMVTFGVRLDPRSALAVTVTQTYPGGDLVRAHFLRRPITLFSAFRRGRLVEYRARPRRRCAAPSFATAPDRWPRSACLDSGWPSLSRCVISRGVHRASWGRTDFSTPATSSPVTSCVIDPPRSTTALGPARGGP